LTGKPKAATSPTTWPILAAVVIITIISQTPQLTQAGQVRPTITVSARANASTAAHPYTLLLVGGPGPMDIDISLSADGRTYLISANGPLEVGIQACVNPPGDQDRLICQAPAIGAFEINGGESNDMETLAKTVPVPATLRGGSGNDVLIGGSHDTLIGRSGDDTLIGRGSHDRLYGGSGNDRLQAEGHNDTLNGGPGHDTCNGNPVYDRFVSCEVVPRGIRE
jgi:RTX calcium-binding nonapeptide repeat (4 copies)